MTGIIRTNAAGKSTILESLEWAIFGGRPVRGSVKVLKWYNAPPRSGIRVDWGIELGGGKALKVIHTATAAKVFTAGECLTDGTNGRHRRHGQGHRHEPRRKVPLHPPPPIHNDEQVATVHRLDGRAPRYGNG